MGDRVWIDFPGELTRARKFRGSGPVNEIRLGKPQKGVTRFVIEFNKSISIDPKKLKLVGTSPDGWELSFDGIPTQGLITIGEGNLIKVSRRVEEKIPITSSYPHINLADLPEIPRGRYRVVIDPGHGGPDSGAVGLRGIRETDVVLDISLQIAEILRKKGVKVNMTRNTEIDLDLPPRVALANRLDADAFVSVECTMRSQRRLRV